MEAMTLEESIELLEINDLHSLKEGDLKLIRNRAKRRWHYDKIMHKNPSESEVNRYNENTYKVDVAIEVIEAYINGKVNVGGSSNEKIDIEDPIDVIKRNAEGMKAELAKKWNEIKEKSYKKKTETILVSDGISIKEALKADREDQVFFKCVLSMVGGSFSMLSLVILLLIIYEPAMIFGVLLIGFLYLSCFVGMLPLARIWLPKFLYVVVYAFIDFGMASFNFINTFLNNMLYRRRWRDEGVLSDIFLLILNIPVFIGKIIAIFIISPIYILAGEIFKKYRIGSVKEKVDYYGGLADWYIDQLLGRSIDEMSDDDLYSLSHAYNELTTV